MSVLEICQLKLGPHLSPTDPRILQSLVQVRSALASKIVRTSSRFYQCIEDPSAIYIFGLWPSLSSHHAFLASPHKPEILAPQADLLAFGWILHIPLSQIDDLPFEAPVMRLARFVVESGDEAYVQFQRVLETARARIVERTKPWGVVDGWRCDGEVGRREAVVFSGWESVRSHEEFTEMSIAADPEYGSMRDLCDFVEVRHMRNMEA